MKRSFGILLFLVFSISPAAAFATILGTANLNISWSDPTGSVTFFLEPGRYYLDYDAFLDGSPSSVEVFCVEDVAAPSSGQDYTLLSIDGSLSSFGLDPLRYIDAARIAANYYDKGEDWKAAAQIAVWEVIFDYGDIQLNNGNLQTDDYYGTLAQGILNQLGSDPFINTDISGWALAVNPLLSVTDPEVKVGGYQNYLVPNPVPEPATMLLVGIGLIGLAGLGRKKLIKR